jgi:hypothetical protein
MNEPYIPVIQPLTVDEKAAREQTRALMEQTFTIAFEILLEGVSNGRPLSELLAAYHTPINTSMFRAWVYKDASRKNAWLTAKAIGAEAVEDEMLQIADGLTSSEDIQRSKLRIETRKWLMGVWNRKKYGDIKHVETTTTTVDMSNLNKDELRMKVLAALGMDSDSSEVFSTSYEDI